VWSVFDELGVCGDGYVLYEGCGESLGDRVKSVGTYLADKSEEAEGDVDARGCCIGSRCCCAFWFVEIEVDQQDFSFPNRSEHIRRKLNHAEVRCGDAPTKCRRGTDLIFKLTCAVYHD
jgi:hypothetical protein